MKKKNLNITLIISACSIALMNIPINSRMAERSFTQRFGATGYLLNAATRFRNYEFDKAACKKKKMVKKKKQKKCRRKK